MENQFRYRILETPSCHGSWRVISFRRRQNACIGRLTRTGFNGKKRKHVRLILLLICRGSRYCSAEYSMLTCYFKSSQFKSKVKQVFILLAENMCVANKQTNKQKYCRILVCAWLHTTPAVRPALTEMKLDMGSWISAAILKCVLWHTKVRYTRHLLESVQLLNRIKGHKRLQQQSAFQ